MSPSVTGQQPPLQETQDTTVHEEERRSRLGRIKDKLMYGPMARYQTYRQRRTYMPQNASDEYYLERHTSERYHRNNRIAAITFIGGVLVASYLHSRAIDFDPGFADGDPMELWQVFTKTEEVHEWVDFKNPPGIQVFPTKDDYVVDWWPGGGEPDLDPDVSLPEPDVSVPEPDIDVDVSPEPDVDVSPEPDVPDVDAPEVDAPGAEAGDTVQTEKEREMKIIAKDFRVENGHGITHEIIDQGQVLGVDVSPEESFKIYQKMEARYGADMIQGPGTYQYNGEIRISAPGQARWNAEAIEFMQRQLELLEEEEDNL